MTQLLLSGSDAKARGISTALIVLDLVVVVALLGCSSLLVMRRQKGVNWRILPIWAVMAAIWAWVWYYIWYVVESITDRLTAPFDYDINLIYGLLCVLFEHAAICFLFCAFYRLTHILLRAFNSAGKLPAKVNIVHWIILVLIVIMSIADFALWVVVDFSFLVLDGDYRPVGITRSVLIWLASWEITAWAVFLVIKAKRTSILKWPAIALLCGSTAFSAMTFMWIVDFLRWYEMVVTYTIDEEIDSLAARSFLEIFFCVGTYGGIMAFCLFSHKLEEKNDAGIALQQSLAQNTQPRIQEADSSAVMQAEASAPVVEGDGSRAMGAEPQSSMDTKNTTHD